MKAWTVYEHDREEYIEKESRLDSEGNVIEWIKYEYELAEQYQPPKYIPDNVIEKMLSVIKRMEEMKEAKRESNNCIGRDKGLLFV